MIEIAKCKCGCSAGVTYRNVHKSILAVQCNSGVCWCGPDDDSAERAISEWNALMASQSVAPKAGTVRVRIQARQIEGQVQISYLRDAIGQEVNFDENGADHLCWITADIPLPHPVEVEGKVRVTHE